jgi:protein SCO1/2
MERRKWAIFLLIGLFISGVTGCSEASQDQTERAKQTQAPPTNDVSALHWQVHDFTFTDQSGKPFGLKDLKGKVWLADFIFTRCPNVCPPMTANMAKVQEAFKKANVPIEFVSFSVDPDYDKPEVLQSFAKKYQVDLSHWHFLTGYKFSQIEQMAQETFKGPVAQQKGPSADMPILVTHPTKFYLIDRTGTVARYYDGLEPDPQQIIKDVQELEKK